jgi:hypothetical protein
MWVLADKWKRGAAMPPSLCILALKDEVLRERRIKHVYFGA